MKLWTHHAWTVKFWKKIIAPICCLRSTVKCISLSNTKTCSVVLENYRTLVVFCISIWKPKIPNFFSVLKVADVKWWMCVRRESKTKCQVFRCYWVILRQKGVSRCLLCGCMKVFCIDLAFCRVKDCGHLNLPISSTLWRFWRCREDQKPIGLKVSTGWQAYFEENEHK